MSSTIHRRKRSQYKYTPELKDQSRLLKNKAMREKALKVRQSYLFALRLEGADYVKECQCSKLFDERTYGVAAGKRQWCPGCPLRPPGRVRTVTRFLKTTGQYVERTYTCKR